MTEVIEQVDEPIAEVAEVAEATESQQEIPANGEGELMARIIEAESACMADEEAMEESKAELKERKAKYEASVARLRSLVRTLGRDRDRPLLALAEGAQQAGDEQWRATDLGALGLTSRISKALCEAGIDTLGKLADYTASEKQLTDIEGIGAKAAEDIDAATAAFWASRVTDEEEFDEPVDVRQQRPSVVRNGSK